MSTYLNQYITTSHGKRAFYATVWHDPRVTAFRFGGVLIHTRDDKAIGGRRSHICHGLSVAPRHVWQMAEAVHEAPERAVMVDEDGRENEVWVTRLTYPSKTYPYYSKVELRAGDRTGPVIARLTPQAGYVDGSTQHTATETVGA